MKKRQTMGALFAKQDVFFVSNTIECSVLCKKGSGITAFNQPKRYSSDHSLFLSFHLKCLCNWNRSKGWRESYKMKKERLFVKTIRFITTVIILTKLIEKKPLAILAVVLHLFTKIIRKQCRLIENILYGTPNWNNILRSVENMVRFLKLIICFWR